MTPAFEKISANTASAFTRVPFLVGASLVAGISTLPMLLAIPTTIGTSAIVKPAAVIDKEAERSVMLVRDWAELAEAPFRFDFELAPAPFMEGRNQRPFTFVVTHRFRALPDPDLWG